MKVKSMTQRLHRLFLISSRKKLDWKTLVRCVCVCVCVQLGYMWLIATKAFFMSGQATPVFALAMSGMMALVSIVNRGVASGGAKAGQRFGASIVGLFQSYMTLLWKRSRESFGPVEGLAVGVFIGSLLMYGRSVWDMIQTSKSSS